jgi:Tol biopolymer transport system component
VFACFVGAADAPGEASPAVPRLHGRVAFVRYSARVGRPRIFVVGAARATRTAMLVRLPGHAVEAPALSPDGRLLAFVAGRNAKDSPGISGGADLFVSTPSGSRVRRLTRHSARVGGPAWSPDGRRLAFVVQNAKGDRSTLWVVGLQGRPPHRVTSGPLDLEPSWAPNGRTIAFLRIDPRSFHGAILSMRPDGSGVRPILSGVRNAAEPVWSPDGKRLLVQDGRAIYSVRPSGGKRTVARLTADARGALEDPQPAWSPDGKWIVFCQFRTGSVGRSDLWVVGADGTGLRRLTSSPGLDTDPTWAP